MGKPMILMLSDVSGLGSEYHVGDEAMAEVAIGRLKGLVGSKNLILGCASPQGIPSTYGIKSFSFYHTTDAQQKALIFAKPLSYIKSVLTNYYHVLKCDVVFVCGGGNMTSVWPEVLESRLRLLRIAKFFNKKIVLVSQTLGPYNEVHREAINAILKAASYVGVRDRDFSRRQVKRPVHFALDDACFLREQHNECSKKIALSSGEFVCVSMRQFGGMTDDNVLTVARSIKKVIARRQLNTVFIPHHAPQGDVRLAESIKTYWEGLHFHIVSPILIASSLKALTSESQWVVSMRYHQLIFALSMGVPCVGIYVDEYTQAKLTGSFASFGLEPLVVSIGEVDEKLDSLVSTAIERRSLFKAAAANLDGEQAVDSMKPYINVTC